MKIAFDIGATHMRAAALEGEGLDDVRAADTPQDFDEAMRVLGELIIRAVGSEPVEAVAGGSPGNIVDCQIDGNIPYLPQWDGRDIAGALHERFPAARITIDNDGQVGCLGEARAGAGKEFNRVAYVCVGSGIGGGLCVSGQLEPRGEFRVGRQVMDAQGHTLEDLAGGEGVKERYGRRWDDLSPEEYREVIGVLAKGLKGAATHWQPDVLVLGGAIPFIFPTFLHDLQEKLPGVALALAAHGERSVLWGARELLR